MKTLFVYYKIWSRSWWIGFLVSLFISCLSLGFIFIFIYAIFYNYNSKEYGIGTLLAYFWSIGCFLYLLITFGKDLIRYPFIEHLLKITNTSLTLTQGFFCGYGKGKYTLPLTVPLSDIQEVTVENSERKGQLLCIKINPIFFSKLKFNLPYNNRPSHFIDGYKLIFSEPLSLSFEELKNHIEERMQKRS